MRHVTWLPSATGTIAHTVRSVLFGCRGLPSKSEACADRG